MLREKINVTKSFLPPIEQYQDYIKQIFNNCFLTNQGPLLQDLEKKLSNYLDVENFHFLSNGTMAIQLALNSLDIIDAEIITTPFSYVATTTSILWEQNKPVFVDIEPDNFTICADKIEEAITPKTKAILAVHVFGYACQIEKIEAIAETYNLKVIYDGAHAFGAKYKNKSLLNYGDITTCSFHATKLFHTVEGGACIVRNKEVSDKLELAKRFGHNGYEHLQLGINAKNSEFHAAMGLCNFEYIDEIIEERRKLSLIMDKRLNALLQRPKLQKDLEYNYSYYPVVFNSEEQLQRVFKALNKENIFPRRYFYPSLNKLSYLKEHVKCPLSEDISLRVACLPLYNGLKEEVIHKIINIIEVNF